VDEIHGLVHNIPDDSTASLSKKMPRLGCGPRGRRHLGEWLFCFARIVPLQVVGDLMGGTVRLAWRKLRPYIEEERRRSGSRKTFEWFQWLAIQLERHSPGKTNLQVGAYEAYLDWNL
jgi:hypothetical protein